MLDLIAYTTWKQWMRQVNLHGQLFYLYSGGEAGMFCSIICHLLRAVLNLFDIVFPLTMQKDAYYGYYYCQHIESRDRTISSTVGSYAECWTLCLELFSSHNERISWVSYTPTDQPRCHCRYPDETSFLCGDIHHKL